MTEPPFDPEPARDRMFVFSFGSQNYDNQCAVVVAPSREEARRMLREDIQRQRARLGFTDPDRSITGHHEPGEVENGFMPFYHSVPRMVEAEEASPPALPREIVGRIAYTYGADG